MECNFNARGTVSEERFIEDERKPIYLVLLLDKSGSMSCCNGYENELGVAESKIEQLNDGVRRVLNSLRKFEESDPVYKVYLQIIYFGTYAEEVYPEFMPVAKELEVPSATADGITNLGAAFESLDKYIDLSKLRDDRPSRKGKGYNKHVSVILMSDGAPTDTHGMTLSFDNAKAIVDKFHASVEKKGFGNHIDYYTISVGADGEGERVLRYIADGDKPSDSEGSRFYGLGEAESIAQMLDIVTHATIANCAQQNVNAGTVPDVNLDVLLGNTTIDNGDTNDDSLIDSSDNIIVDVESDDIELDDVGDEVEIDDTNDEVDDSLTLDDIDDLPSGGDAVVDGEINLDDIDE